MIDSHLHFWKYSADEFPWIQGDLAPIAQDMLPEDLCSQLTDNIDGIIAVQARPCCKRCELRLPSREASRRLHPHCPHLRNESTGPA